MGKFMDALRMKPPTSQARTYQDGDNPTVAQPVPVAFIRQPTSDLTAGSSLNKASDDSWPQMLDGGYKWRGGWVPSKLIEVRARNIAGNYGMVTSKANFGFLYSAFRGIGLHSSPIPSPYRPMYDNLTPISWALRVDNPAVKTNRQLGSGKTVQKTPATFPGSNTASLNRTGDVLL